MPSMIGWSRKEAEAFASLAGIELNFKGVGTIYKQSVSKGKTLKDKQKVTVEAK
jgi:penicillin-binding protein 2B